ncbi:hypothetical protein [Ralstonia pickettii]|uniref:hypothetical protein n=1 Tax=Ralstonia pickettii TaxID=329 RepID=UPI003F67FBB4
MDKHIEEVERRIEALGVLKHHLCALRETCSDGRAAESCRGCPKVAARALETARTYADTKGDGRKGSLCDRPAAVCFLASAISASRNMNYNHSHLKPFLPLRR